MKKQETCTVARRTLITVAIFVMACGSEDRVATNAAPSVDGGSDVVVEDGAPACTPQSCAELGAQCGVVPDGCGGTVNCGGCPAPQFCGGGGPYQCGDTQCTPKTCTQLGWSCGTVSDGCAATLDCGSCLEPQICQAGSCGCPPPTQTCGSRCVDTGNDPENCGACDKVCPIGELCVGGKCVDPCVPDPCHGHGWCTLAGTCECDPGYGGAFCSVCDGVWQPVVGTSPTVCEPTNVVEGTAGDDVLYGTVGPDKITGNAGNDEIRGRDGDDLLLGGEGADYINGMVGRDAIYGGSGNDTLHGGAGDDLVIGGGGDDFIFGGGGNDRLIGGEGNDVIDGGDGDDRYMLDGLGHDTIVDESGFDVARCMPGVKILSDSLDGPDRVLTFSTGGSVRIIANSVELVVGCH